MGMPQGGRVPEGAPEAPETGDYVVILVTTPTAPEATRIARALVEARLLACGNVIPSVLSTFRWEGEVSQEREALLVGKGRRSALPRIVEMVKSLHTYSVPEIIALPLAGGSGDYLQWLGAETEGA